MMTKMMIVDSINHVRISKSKFQDDDDDNDNVHLLHEWGENQSNSERIACYEKEEKKKTIFVDSNKY